MLMSHVVRRDFLSFQQTITPIAAAAITKSRRAKKIPIATMPGSIVETCAVGVGAATGIEVTTGVGVSFGIAVTATIMIILYNYCIYWSII